MAFPNVLSLGSACRALFPTYLPLYLLSKSSPALLERLEGAILGALRLVRGNKRYENHKLYLQVLPSVPSVCVHRDCSAPVAHLFHCPGHCVSGLRSLEWAEGARYVWVVGSTGRAGVLVAFCLPSRELGVPFSPPCRVCAACKATQSVVRQQFLSRPVRRL